MRETHWHTHRVKFISIFNLKHCGISKLQAFL